MMKLSRRMFSFTHAATCEFTSLTGRRRLVLQTSSPRVRCQLLDLACSLPCLPSVATIGPPHSPQMDTPADRR